MSDLSNKHTAATTTIEEAKSLSQAFLAVAGALRGSGQPDAVFAVLERLYRQRVGFKMLTFMTTDREARIGRRVFTTSPETHPVGADKPVTESDWIEMVLDRQEIFVANSVEDFRPHYVDWEFLREMGIGSAINYPIVVNGTTIGAVNLTAEPGYYTPERVAAGEPLSGLSALAFLLLDHLANRRQG